MCTAFQDRLNDTQSRLSARRSDTTAARLAEAGRRWCHCLYAPEGCVLAMERGGKEGPKRFSWFFYWIPKEGKQEGVETKSAMRRRRRKVELAT